MLTVFAKLYILDVWQGSGFTTLLYTKLKRFHVEFFELEMLKNLKLSIVALLSAINCSPYKRKKIHQKDASHLKNNKNSLHGKRCKKGIEKGKKNERWKVSETFNKLTTTIKFFTFIFCLRKRIYFARKHSLGKCILYHFISSKVLFSVARYLKQSNEIPTFI